MRPDGHGDERRDERLDEQSVDARRWLSPVGILLAALVVVWVIVWILIDGPTLFSPGDLNAQPQGRELGGVTTHAQLQGDCEACHPAPWSSRTTADSCLACHTGVAGQVRQGVGLHGRLFAGSAAPTCSGCHTEHNGPHAALTILDAGRFDHDLTGFSLASHRRTAQGAGFTCKDCHTRDLMTLDQATCADCHSEDDPAFMEAHIATFGTDCLECHDGGDTDASSYPHDKGPFRLVGAHREVACADCHADARTAEQSRNTPQDCYSCHAEDDEHEGAYGRSCADCHTPAAWDDATFEHTVFPLDHGEEERRAGCQTCHPTGTDTYTCLGCHEHSEARVLDKHEGASLQELVDCVECHAGGRGGEED